MVSICSRVFIISPVAAQTISSFPSRYSNCEKRKIKGRLGYLRQFPRCIWRFLQLTGLGSESEIAKLNPNQHGTCFCHLTYCHGDRFLCGAIVVGVVYHRFTKVVPRLVWLLVEPRGWRGQKLRAFNRVRSRLAEWRNGFRARSSDGQTWNNCPGCRDF